MHNNYCLAQSTPQHLAIGIGSALLYLHTLRPRLLLYPLRTTTVVYAPKFSAVVLKAQHPTASAFEQNNVIQRAPASSLAEASLACSVDRVRQLDSISLKYYTSRFVVCVWNATT